MTYNDVGPDSLLSFRGLLHVLQEAAAVASDEVGYGIKDIPRTGVHWILSGWRAELLARPGWRAPLTVRTWPRGFDGFLSDRDFLVYSGETPVARGTSRWLLINAHTGRIARISQEVQAAYRSQVDSRAVFDAPLRSNGKSPADAPVAFSSVVGRRDIDTNGHVNNIHYLDYAMEALPEEVFTHLPATVEISFRRQLLLGTPFRCLYTLTEDGRHQVEIQSGEDPRPTHNTFIWFY